MKQHTTNFFAYTFQVIALLLLFSFSPSENEINKYPGSSAIIKNRAFAVSTSQTKAKTYPFKLSSMPNTFLFQGLNKQCIAGKTLKRTTLISHHGLTQ